MVGFLPGLLTSGGIIGSAGQALSLLLAAGGAEVGGVLATALAAAIVMLLLWTGRYLRLERVLLAMVMSFTFLTYSPQVVDFTGILRIRGVLP